MVPRDLVVELASILQLEDGAFLVGGQALNLWAETYSARAPELAEFGPYTSKDIDYFGRVQAAEKLARALGGKVNIPTIDEATPHTATVEADFQGQHLIIDFLGAVLGVEPAVMELRAINLKVPMTLGSEAGYILIPVMHPVHCLQSRVANVRTLHRHTLLAERQLNASPIIVREYVKEVLDAGYLKEVHRTLRELFEYFRRSPEGRRSLRDFKHDPLATFEQLRFDERLDARYREKTIQPMIDRLNRVRSLFWPKPLEGAGLAEPEDGLLPPKTEEA